jgi:hypothetical protein
MLHHIDRLTYPSPEAAHTFGNWDFGHTVVMLTTTGQQPALTMLGLPDGDNLVVIASNWGSTSIPPGTTSSAPILRLQSLLVVPSSASRGP